MSVVYRVGSALLSALPRRLALTLGEVIGTVLYHRSSRQKIVVTANLAHVVETSTRQVKITDLVRASYRSYGRYWAESAHLRARDRGRLVSAHDIEGLAHYEDARRSGNGVVLVLPHLGAWEVGALFLAGQGTPLTTVAERAEPEALFDWFVARRAALGITVLTLGEQTVPQLLRVLHNGGVIALLSDRDVGGDGIAVEFFGEQTKIPGGPALLALRSGATLLACAIYQQPGGRYKVVVRPLIAAEREGRLRVDIARVTQSIASELEALIRTAPEQWHIFQPNWPSVRALVPNAGQKAVT